MGCTQSENTAQEAAQSNEISSETEIVVTKATSSISDVPEENLDVNAFRLRIFQEGLPSAWRYLENKKNSFRIFWMVEDTSYEDAFERVIDLETRLRAFVGSALVVVTAVAAGTVHAQVSVVAIGNINSVEIPELSMEIDQALQFAYPYFAQGDIIYNSPPFFSSHLGMDDLGKDSLTRSGSEAFHDKIYCFAPSDNVSAAAAKDGEKTASNFGGTFTCTDISVATTSTAADLTASTTATAIAANPSSVFSEYFKTIKEY